MVQRAHRTQEGHTGLAQCQGSPERIQKGRAYGDAIIAGTNSRMRKRDTRRNAQLEVARGAHT